LKWRPVQRQRRREARLAEKSFQLEPHELQSAGFCENQFRHRTDLGSEILFFIRWMAVCGKLRRPETGCALEA
jgi:hypothetical protein